MLNLDSEISVELPNDEKQISKYLLEKYPELKYTKLRRLEKIFKVMTVLFQGVVLIFNRNESFSKDESEPNETNWWISVVAGILCLLASIWLSLKIAPSKFPEIIQVVMEILFLLLILTIQVLLFELYLNNLTEFFQTAVHSTLILFLAENYIRHTKIGVTAQVFSVLYIQIRYLIYFKLKISQMIVGSLLFSLIIFQNFTRKVLYSNKMQIIRITRNQLNSVRQFYNDLLGLIPQGLTLLDSGSNIIYANTRVTEILQCDKKEIYSILMNLSNNNKVGRKDSDEDERDESKKYIPTTQNMMTRGNIQGTISINGGDSSIFTRNAIHSMSSKKSGGTKYCGFEKQEKRSSCRFTSINKDPIFDRVDTSFSKKPVNLSAILDQSKFDSSFRTPFQKIDGKNVEELQKARGNKIIEQFPIALTDSKWDTEFAMAIEKELQSTKLQSNRFQIEGTEKAVGQKNKKYDDVCSIKVQENEGNPINQPTSPRRSIRFQEQLQIIYLREKPSSKVKSEGNDSQDKWSTFSQKRNRNKTEDSPKRSIRRIQRNSIELLGNEITQKQSSQISGKTIVEGSLSLFSKTNKIILSNNNEQKQIQHASQLPRKSLENEQLTQELFNDIINSVPNRVYPSQEDQVEDQSLSENSKVQPSPERTAKVKPQRNSIHQIRKSKQISVESNARKDSSNQSNYDSDVARSRSKSKSTVNSSKGKLQFQSPTQKQDILNSPTSSYPKKRRKDRKRNTIRMAGEMPVVLENPMSSVASAASSLITPFDSRPINGIGNKTKADYPSLIQAIEPENMSLKKCVISRSETKDSAYKSLFQSKIIKKETRVVSILNKLFNLNKLNKKSAQDDDTDQYSYFSHTNSRSAEKYSVDITNTLASQKQHSNYLQQQHQLQFSMSFQPQQQFLQQQNNSVLNNSDQNNYLLDQSSGNRYATNIPQEQPLSTSVQVPLFNQKYSSKIPCEQDEKPKSLTMQFLKQDTNCVTTREKMLSQQYSPNEEKKFRIDAPDSCTERNQDTSKNMNRANSFFNQCKDKQENIELFLKQNES